MTSPEIIEILLKAKANVEDRDNNGNSPLIKAMTLSASLDVIDCLIANGANLYGENPTDGNSALLEGMLKFLKERLDLMYFY